MAEVADILTFGKRTVILPDLAAGCSMADMANLVKVRKCWAEISEVLDPDRHVTPVTYINSASDLTAFCGRHGGIVRSEEHPSELMSLMRTSSAAFCFTN